MEKTFLNPVNKFEGGGKQSAVVGGYTEFIRNFNYISDYMMSNSMLMM